MAQIVETTWWLEWRTSEYLHWARLRIFQDGTAEVFDLDGKYHHFPNCESARLWLNEDEYSLLAHMIENCEVEAEVVPPYASDDKSLAPLMSVDRRAAS